MVSLSMSSNSEKNPVIVMILLTQKKQYDGNNGDHITVAL